VTRQPALKSASHIDANRRSQKSRKLFIAEAITEKNIPRDLIFDLLKAKKLKKYWVTVAVPHVRNGKTYIQPTRKLQISEPELDKALREHQTSSNVGPFPSFLACSGRGRPGTLTRPGLDRPLIREPGFRVRELVVVTTLTDTPGYSKDAILDLFHDRWWPPPRG
jgi:hypothetical protein